MVSQTVEQCRAIGGVLMQMALGFLNRLRRECLDGGVLRQHRWADREVSGQTVHRATELSRHQQPTKPPPRHREVLGKAVDHECVSRRTPGAAGLRGAVIDQSVINLVADQPHSRFVTPGRDRRELLGRDHRAGWVGGAGHHDTLHRRIELGQHLRGRLETGLGAAFDHHDLAPQRRQDVAVAGIAGAADRHPSPTSKQDRNASRKPPDDPVVTTTSSTST